MSSCDNKEIVKEIKLCPNSCGKIIIYTNDINSYELTTGRRHICDFNLELSTQLHSDAVSDGQTLKVKRKNTRKKPKLHDVQAGWKIDKTFMHLVNIQTKIKTPAGKLITVYKYYYQAWNILRDTRDGEIQNPFPIFVSDLSPDLVHSLLDSRSKDYVISQVVENIFKNSNLRLYEMVTNKRGGLQYDWIFL